eukprot:TRINITY_DN38046_c0_g1_i1.p1 TRINITY_DN38046_c0_g1~~TRINITY_DN38046_c0_g1_i1.p1  ORF type:complete len:706 (-),score=73.39 TRINITY_DN38046_c0_g1_i1:6-2123(-)
MRRLHNMKGAPCAVVLITLLSLTSGETSGMTDLLSRGDHACLDPGAEDWPSIHRTLLRVIDRRVTLEDLRPALARASETDPSLDDRDSPDKCVLGHISLRMLLLLASGQLGPGHAAQVLAPDWSVVRSVGLVSSIRSGWPLFRLLRSLQEVTSRSAPESGPPACEESLVERKYIDILEQYVVHRSVPPGETLIAASMSYLAEATERCPLTVAAAFLAVAWSRFPVYDADTEALIGKAEGVISSVDLSTLVSARHPFLRVLDDVASTYQAFLIDSGSLYSTKTSDSESDSKVVDYTRHMMDDAAFAAGSGGDCVVSFARTPLGRCNVFAPIPRSLNYWRSKGVQFEDTLFAFRQITDQKNILFRIIGEELYMVTPRHSHFSAEFGAMEPTCLAQGLLALLAKVEIPSVDFVLNHGDLPLLRGLANRPPFYGPEDRDARFPAPLFSICASEDFWDIPFPNTCRPALVNISNLSKVPWADKRKIAFWRGTDRGAVNWAIRYEDMWRGSPRKQFLDRWGDDSYFNLAFLNDDLLNATVVNTDENFVPLEGWLNNKYLLDLPGNGYSGSLKQKLTGSSAVLLLTDIDRAGATPVYEHYHAGLQDRTHVLSVTMKNAGTVLKWATDHDAATAKIVGHANEYMSHFEEYTQCYLWRLLTLFGQLLRYTPSPDQIDAFGDTNVHVMHIHRRPTKRESKEFEDNCLRIIDEAAL